MATSGARLFQLQGNLDESLGARWAAPTAKLSPVPARKDVGRKPARDQGELEINRIMADPDQPRRHFDEESLARLADSLRTHGQQQPIQVRWSPADDKWVVVAGERRWRAAQAAGLKTLRCVFLEGALPAPQLLERQLIENLLREDLTPLEQANGFAELMRSRGWNGKQVAEALSIPASTVSRALALLRLPPSIQAQVAAGEIPARSAYELSKVTDPSRQAALAMQAAQGELTHADVEQQAKSRRVRAANRAGLKLAFPTETGLTVRVEATDRCDYHTVERALVEALDEVRLRLRNRIQIR